MAELQAIGSKILVGLPSLGLKDVPAKVDTGAYTSSIWASNFSESNGELSFTLFAPGSPLYTGDVIKTREYEIKQIKSSFGHIELRYIVKLSVKIGSKIIKATFSLADRSANRYPVLIGRRTIMGKFVVDVTKNTIKDRYKILVIDFKQINTVQKFFANISAAHPKLEIDVCTFDDIELKLDAGKTIFRLRGQEVDVRDYDYVFFKSTSSQTEMSAALAHHLAHSEVPFMDRANLFWPLNGKVAQYIAMQTIGIPVPKTIYMKPGRLAQSYGYIAAELGIPFVVKDARGSKGRNNFLVRSEDDFARAMEVAKSSDKTMLAQKLVPNDGDFRVLVLGNKVRLVIHRRAKSDDTHLNNTSAGGHATIVDLDALPTSIKQMSIDAADVLKFDVAGVDMIKDKVTGEWYCLEVNNGPQIASGSFVPEKNEAFGNFLIELLEKGI